MSRWRRHFTVLLAAFFAFVGTVTAVQPPIETMPDNAAYLWQMVFGLLVVLGIILALAWFLRRFGQGGFLVNPQMKVISSLSLGTRERVVMIEVGDRQILLGVAPGRVSALHVFSTPIIDTATEQKNSDFGNKLRQIIHRDGVK